MGICRFAPDVTSKERVEDVYLGLVWINKNHKKTVKNEQARTRESEEYKSRKQSQESQASVKSSQSMFNLSWISLDMSFLEGDLKLEESQALTLAISIGLELTMGGNDDEARSSRSKRSRQYEIVEVVLLRQVHHEFLLWDGCNKEVKSRMGYDREIDDMLRIKLCEAGSNEEIFTSVA
ncbi:hypothetical protein Tco_0662457 [Tanacetum coccineum]